ncbi:superfamily I DNA/RNA helicase [Burkholderia pseudomallei]|uniref:ATP-dependent helicase n=1 Tax=Burkholderia pseudomallei TaxID=28450 RepID=UPI000F04EEBB|nr:ATP-dependent DNA helicase [Burkholderia pseudomallei]CAJ4543387.1 superfamily I DNA/RNA helicase [Burkholderia pseudomallei]CAJ5220987.1 superfamily I DNA/RNA helicase [Burkholderia pseudomallei]CAJ6063999.1 superfamily I DNA/RNA helicase [Burkholderia pseudomallei]VBD67071.1 superfamily I DNA/RNA helicase [Burkholderia pseudomallei]VBL27602.1 superfamily I DNA/RNA helicase [Burkholderia pseudomallei]
MTSNATIRQSKANPQQLEAILATDGPVLIIAGPGSGKTFTLVERIVYLITQKGVVPESLLVVTFTDKAARELTTRISNRLAEVGIQFNLNEMYLGTFHSICLRLLEDYREFTRLKRSFTLFDQFDQQYFLYQHIKDFRELPDAQLVMGDDQTGRWAQSENLLKWLNKVSEEALDATTLAAAPEPEIRALATCFAKYQELLHEHNSLDFSGIQFEALQLLEKRPEVLGQLREKLTHLMVDEYQDTNTIQERILLLLAGERRNLCVVGDDDQGLYRFRGATIRNILEFPTLFDDGQCKQVKLTVNYRSHPDIIRFYNEWMKEQVWDDGTRVFRFAKQIVPRGDEFPDLPTAVRLAASDDKDDATNWHAEVLAFLNGLKASCQLSDWNQVAFLFRSVKNDKVVALARFLEAQGVPVFSPRSNMFFEREEIRLMIGALIFLFPQFPKVRAWMDGITLPIWDYYDHQCFKPFIDELRKPENKPLLDWARPLAKRHAVLAQNTDYAFSGLFYQLLQFPLFSRFLTEVAVQGVDKGRAARNLGTFSKLLTKFEYLHYVSVLNPEWLEKNLRDLFNQFMRFLVDGGIGEYEDESEYAPKGCVSFLTIHQSKGLEFPVVVCGSLEAVPRKQYSALDVLLEDGGYLSKERFEPLDHIKNFDFWRLFYTAFSRAQNLLVLAAQEKQGRGKSPSKYFERLFYEIPSWRDIDLSALTFEAVKQINLKREYSFTSHITVFENCAEQYRFFKELEFAPIRESPMLFGTLVHQTIEDIHKTVLRGEEASITFDAIKGWFSANYAMLSKKERVYLAPSSQQAALLHVLRYYDRENGNWDRIKEAEVEISLIKDQYILKGSVDLIRGEHDTVEIIDFKSEKKPDMEKDRDRLHQYQHQLEVYAHLVEERTGQKVSRMHLYYTGEDGGNPYVSFTKDDRAIGKTIARFDDIVARIERQDYGIAARPAKLCQNCDMRAYCDNKNWKFRNKD